MSGIGYKCKINGCEHFGRLNHTNDTHQTTDHIVSILSMLLDVMPLIFPKSCEANMFSVALTLTYCAFLRVVKFTVSKADIACHTILNLGQMVLLIMFSKTDQTGKWFTIVIPQTGKALCPVATMHSYLAVYPDIEGPPFRRYRLT